MSDILYNFLVWLTIFIKEWLPVIKDLALIGAAIIGGYVGIQGLGAWREQLKGKTEYELAKQLLRSVYQLREAIASVRHPGTTRPLNPDMPKEQLESLSPKQKEYYSWGEAYANKWKPVGKAIVFLNEGFVEAEVLWGQQMVETVRPLKECILELSDAIYDFVESKNPDNEPEKLDRDERKDRKLIMYDILKPDRNKYTKKLEDAITAIEKELKPHIGQYHKVQKNQKPKPNSSFQTE